METALRRRILWGSEGPPIGPNRYCDEMTLPAEKAGWYSTGYRTAREMWVVGSVNLVVIAAIVVPSGLLSLRWHLA